jgi:hypothetical protein
MAISASAPAPLWFRIAACVALVWNAFGVVMFLSSVGAFGDPTAGLSEAERAIVTNIPDWIMAAFGIGTFSGLAGSLGLLLGRRWAWPLLLISLIALLVLESYMLFFSGAAAAVSGVAIPINVIVGALLLAWLARYAGHRGWLR